MDQMLDAGFWILDYNRKLSLFFQHQESSIQYLAHCGINDRFYDIVIFNSGLSGLCYSIIVCRYVVDYFMFKLCVEQFSGYVVI